VGESIAIRARGRRRRRRGPFRAGCDRAV